MSNSKIFEAIRNGEFSKLAIFIKYNYNFKIKTEPDGENVLMAALDIVDSKRRFKMFEFLLNKNLVDLNECNQMDRDIFFLAVIRNCEMELNLLLERYFGEINWIKMDKEGKTILHHAVNSFNNSILENLLVYCRKYRINVDIPDGVDKITPFLLANKLNNYKAADLLVKIGHASRQQMDEKVFYDAERWKHEGQLEAYKKYIKTKQNEMIQAKVNGNVKLYNFLNNLNTKLDREINKNPELLPLVAKAILENNEVTTSNSKKNSISSNNDGRVEYFQFVKPMKSINDPKVSKSKLISISESKRFQHNGSTSSSYSNSISPLSSAASSKKSSSIVSSDQLNSHRKSSSFDSIIDNIITNKKQSLASLSSTHFNTLLEMTNNKMSVESFVGSKQQDDDFQHQITDMFFQVAIQNTNNYRTAAKKPVTKKVVKVVVPKPKPKTSTLAIIREESITIKPNKSKKNIRKIFNSQNSLPTRTQSLKIK